MFDSFFDKILNDEVTITVRDLIVLSQAASSHVNENAVEFYTKMTDPEGYGMTVEEVDGVAIKCADILDGVCKSVVENLSPEQRMEMLMDSFASMLGDDPADEDNYDDEDDDTISSNLSDFFTEGGNSRLN